MDLKYSQNLILLFYFIAFNCDHSGFGECSQTCGLGMMLHHDVVVNIPLLLYYTRC